MVLFCKIILDRADLEDIYARNLRRISNNLN